MLYGVGYDLFLVNYSFISLFPENMMNKTWVSSVQIRFKSVQVFFPPTKLAFILTEHLITFHNMICFLLYVNELMTDWIDTIG